MTRRWLAAALMAAALGFAESEARANEICAGEFQPLIQRHQQVMQQTQAAIPRGRPRSLEQARANAQRACSALGNATTSFERLRKWVADNKEFCQIPDNIENDIRTGLANAQRNRRQACGAIAQIDRQRRQAAAGGGGPQANDPFNPRAARRPQLDLRTPGALN